MTGSFAVALAPAAAGWSAPPGTSPTSKPAAATQSVGHWAATRPAHLATAATQPARLGAALTTHSAANAPTAMVGPQSELNGAMAAGPWAGVRLGVAIDARTSAKGPTTQPQDGSATVGRPAGLMVVNVVRDGPADNAGLRPFDFIMSVAGEPQAADLAAFNDRLRALKPGVSLPLTIERSGKTREVKLTLAPFPVGKTLAFKYPSEPEPVDGKMRPGEIYIKRDKTLEKFDLDSSSNTRILDQLPPDIREQFLSRLRKQLNPDLLLKASQVFDGMTVTVREDPRGHITVERSSVNGDGSRKDDRGEYASAQALSQNDAQAFEVYQKAQAARGPGATAAAAIAMTPGVASEPPAPAVGTAQAQRSLLSGTAAPVVTSEFSVGRNGEIEVRIQRGDKAIKQTFKNEDEFRKSAPKLYEQYLTLRKAIE